MIDGLNSLLQLPPNIRNPKNDTPRHAYLTPALVDIFKKLSSKKTGLIFPDRNGKRIAQLSDTFNRAVDRLELNKDVTNKLNRVVPHTLRHTFASWLAIQGETLLNIKELMGHKSIEMTERYAHLSPNQKREAVLRLTRDGY